MEMRKVHPGTEPRLNHALVAKRKLRLIAWGGFLLNAISAANYSGGVWVEAFQNEFNVNLATASLVSSMNNVGFSLGALTCFLFPSVARTHHFTLYSVIANAAAFAASSWCVDIGTMIATQGIVLGFTCSVAFLYPTLNLSHHISAKELGKITGFSLAGVGLGLLVWSPMVLAMHKIIGWRSSARGLAVISGVVGMIGVELCRRGFGLEIDHIEDGQHRVDSGGQGGRAVTCTSAEPADQPHQEIERELPPLTHTPQFWLINLYIAFAAVCICVPWTHLSTMTRASGVDFDDQAMEVAFTCAAVGSIVGRLSWGLASDVLGARQALCCDTSAMIVLYLAWPVLASTSPATVAVFAMCFGFLQGGCVVCVATSCMVSFDGYPRSYETKTTGCVWGASFMTGGFAGPVIFGALLEAFSPAVASASVASFHAVALGLSIWLCNLKSAAVRPGGIVIIISQNDYSGSSAGASHEKNAGSGSGEAQTPAARELQGNAHAIGL